MCNEDVELVSVLNRCFFSGLQRSLYLDNLLLVDQHSPAIKSHNL